MLLRLLGEKVAIASELGLSVLFARPAERDYVSNSDIRRCRETAVRVDFLRACAIKVTLTPVGFCFRPLLFARQLATCDGRLFGLAQQFARSPATLSNHRLGVNSGRSLPLE